MNPPIDPPWIRHPGYSPGDPFWRQAGEAWFSLIWAPFWASLSANEKVKYLSQYEVPEDWQCFYFDVDFQNWLESIDK